MSKLSLIEFIYRQHTESLTCVIRWETSSLPHRVWGDRMKNGRMTASGLILIGISVILQTVPAAISHELMLLTVLSALPVFILVKLYPPFGFASYLIIGIGTAMVNPYDAVLFWGVTGMLGLSGGFFYCLTKSKPASAFITACIISMTALSINQLLSLYPADLAYPLPGRSLILIAMLFPCCLAFICASDVIFRQLDSLIELRRLE